MTWQAQPDPDLESMTVAQLREYAEAHNVSLEGLSLKADILARVQEAEAATEQPETIVGSGAFEPEPPA